MGPAAPPPVLPLGPARMEYTTAPHTGPSDILMGCHTAIASSRPPPTASSPPLPLSLRPPPPSAAHAAVRPPTCVRLVLLPQPLPHPVLRRRGLAPRRPRRVPVPLPRHGLCHRGLHVCSALAQPVIQPGLQLALALLCHRPQPAVLACRHLSDLQQTRARGRTQVDTMNRVARTALKKASSNSHARSSLPGSCGSRPAGGATRSTQCRTNCGQP